jgi:hypothetical protein
VSVARPRRSRRRRRRVPRRLLLCLLIAVVFLGGIGLGEALHDNPRVGGTETLIRTLPARALVPVAVDTVTVTVTSP